MDHTTRRALTALFGLLLLPWSVLADSVPDLVLEGPDGSVFDALVVRDRLFVADRDLPLLRSAGLDTLALSPDSLLDDVLLDALPLLGSAAQLGAADVDGDGVDELLAASCDAEGCELLVVADDGTTVQTRTVPLGASSLGRPVGIPAGGASQSVALGVSDSQAARLLVIRDISWNPEESPIITSVEVAGSTAPFLAEAPHGVVVALEDWSLSSLAFINASDLDSPDAWEHARPLLATAEGERGTAIATSAYGMAAATETAGFLWRWTDLEVEPSVHPTVVLDASNSAGLSGAAVDAEGRLAFAAAGELYAASANHAGATLEQADDLFPLRFVDPDSFEAPLLYARQQGALQHLIVLGSQYVQGAFDLPPPSQSGGGDGSCDPHDPDCIPGDDDHQNDHDHEAGHSDEGNGDSHPAPYTGPIITPTYEGFDATTQSSGSVLGGALTVSTTDGHAADGTPISDLLDDAAGTEVVVDGVLHHAIPFFAPGVGAPRGVGITYTDGGSADLGPSWTLSGLPRIERTGPAGGAPNGTSGDTFWYAGQELVFAGGGGPGFRHYRTKQRGPEVVIYDTAADIWTVHLDGAVTTFGAIDGLCGATERGPGLARRAYIDADGEAGSTPLEWTVHNDVGFRWSICRTADAHGSGSLFTWDHTQDDNGYSLHLAAISWGEAAYPGPDPSRSASDRFYELRFQHEDRPDTRVAAGAGTLRRIETRLASVELLAGPAREPQRGWELHYQQAVPSNASVLREIWEVAAPLPGQSSRSRRRLRAFQYHSEWAAPQDEDEYVRAAGDGFDGGARWHAGETLVLPAYERDEDWLSVYYGHPTQVFAKVNHDALPDVVQFRVHERWLRPEQGGSSQWKPPVCSDDCSSTDQTVNGFGPACDALESPFECFGLNSGPCDRVFEVDVFVNVGDLQLVFDPNASQVLTEYVNRAGPPTSRWEDHFARIRFADLNGDGMDDVLGGTIAPLLSDPRADWGGYNLAHLPDSVPLEDRSAGPSAQLADVNGDGILDLLYPPHTDLEEWDITRTEQWFDFTPEQQGDILTADSLPGGMCLLPPERPDDGVPRWTARLGTQDGTFVGSPVSLDLPFFGGPRTGDLAGVAMDLPVGRVQPEFGNSSWNATLAAFYVGSNLPSPYGYPQDNQLVGCTVDGRSGYLVSSQRLATFNDDVSAPWTASSGWEYLAQHMRFDDVNGDGCADVSVAVELFPFFEEIASWEGQDVPPDWFTQTLPAQSDGVYSEVFYGQCNGRFAPQPGGDDATPPPLGVPFSRYRIANEAATDCGSLPFNGLRLGRLCSDPEIVQPWAAPHCQVDDFGLESFCCSPCGAAFEVCEQAVQDGWCTDGFPTSQSGGFDATSVEPPGSPTINQVPVDEADDWHPWLRHRFALNVGQAGYASTASPTVGGQWTDLDRDGQLEWLQLCHREGADDVLLPDPPASPGDDEDYPLALYFPQSVDDLGVGVGQSCEGSPARASGLEFLGMVPLSVDATGRPTALSTLIGQDAASFLIDIDADGFVDQISFHGSNATVRRQDRDLPELTLIGITYETGEASSPNPSDWTGTSYLEWAPTQPLDHPLLPSSAFRLSGVLDGTGYRVWQSFGCRASGGRFRGCQAVVNQGPRGAFGKSLYTTLDDLPGQRWLDARYDVDGHLIDTQIAVMDGSDVSVLQLPYLSGYQLSEIPPTPVHYAPSCCTDWPEIELVNPGPPEELEGDGSFDPTRGHTVFHPVWRQCDQVQPVAPHDFDGTLDTYVDQCAGFTNPHNGASGDIAMVRTLTAQQAWAFPTQDGLVGTLIDFGTPLHAQGHAEPSDLTIREVQWSEEWTQPDVTYDLGWASTQDDDLLYDSTFSVEPGVFRPQLHSQVLSGVGSWSSSIQQSETFARSGATVTGGTLLGAQGETVSWSRTVDAFGRTDAEVDGDGVSSTRAFATACGGLSAEHVGPDGRWVERDASCQAFRIDTTAGLTQAVIYDGFGRALRSVSDPGAGQAAMTSWTLFDDSIGGHGGAAPQIATTDGESATFTFFSRRGHVVLERSCLLASPTMPGTAADLDAMTPADLLANCVTDSIGEVHSIRGEDGIARTTSALDVVADGKSPQWVAREFDAFARQISSGVALGSVADATAGALVPRLVQTVSREHDRTVRTLPDGRVLEEVVSPLRIRRFIDGRLDGTREFRPSGQTTLYHDALGRVTSNEYDGLGRRTGAQLPSFVGIDGSGAQTTLFPDTDIQVSAEGRLDTFLGPDQAGFTLRRDASGRVIGRDRVGPSGVALEFDVAHPAPAAPGVPTEQVTVVSDPDGDAVEYVRDGLGRVVEVRHPDGTSEDSWFDALGRRVAGTDRAGENTVVTFANAGNGRMRFAVQHPDGSETVEFRNATGQLLRSVDPDGVALDLEYDDWGRLVRRWSGAPAPRADLSSWPGGELVVEYVYDALDRVTAECPGGVGSPLLCTHTTYGSDGRVDTVVRASAVWQYTWLDDGSLDQVELLTPGMTRVVVPHYDDAGRVQGVAVNNDLPGLTWFDAAGRKARYEPNTPNHAATKWVYDDAGRLSELHLPGRAAPTTYGYWPDGQLQWVEDGDGMTNPWLPGAADEWFEYDAMGQPILHVDPRGTSFHREYDGAVLSGVRAENIAGVPIQRSEFDWDTASGRITQAYTALTEGCAAVAGPGVPIIDVCGYDEFADAQMDWSPGGRQLALTDANGNTTSWTYDMGPMGGTGRLETRLTETTRRDYTYDGFGRLWLETVGDPSAPDTIIDYGWDDSSRLTDMHWSRDGGADTETEIVAYDALDRRVFAEVQRNGVKVEGVEYGYDHFDRMTELGRVLGSASPSFVAGNGTCEPGELCFDYDVMGQRTGATWPDGRFAELEYVDGALERVWDGPMGGAPTLYEVQSRDVLGRPEKTWKKGGIWEEVAYDVGGEVDTRWVTYDQPVGPGSSAAWDVLIDYDYDELGRLAGRQTLDSAGSPLGTYSETNAWTYNAAGWLVEEDLDGDVYQQEFDRGGNRLSRSLDGVTELMASFGLDNQLLTQTTAEGDTSFTHDANGRREQGSAGEELAYSPRGRLESIGAGLGAQAQYGYGVDGRRVSEVTEEGSRTFLGGPDAWLPWMVESSAGSENLLNVGGAQLLSLSGGDSKAFVTGPDGSPLLGGGIDGSLEWQGRWNAYGESLDASGSAPVSGFGGMLASGGGVGLLSAGMRDYDPTTGTWLQMDPMGTAGDVNSYRFAAGDPVNLSDPSGACISMEAMWANPANARAHRLVRTMLEGQFGRASMAPSSATGYVALPDEIQSSYSPRPGDVSCRMCSETEDPDEYDDEPDDPAAIWHSDGLKRQDTHDLIGGEWVKRPILVGEENFDPTPVEVLSQTNPGSPSSADDATISALEALKNEEWSGDVENDSQEEDDEADSAGPAGGESAETPGTNSGGSKGPGRRAPGRVPPIDWKRAGWSMAKTGAEAGVTFGRAMAEPGGGLRMGIGLVKGIAATYRTALQAGRAQGAGHGFAVVGTIGELLGVGGAYRAGRGRDWFNDRILSTEERSDAMGGVLFDAAMMVAGAGAAKFSGVGRFGRRRGSGRASPKDGPEGAPGVDGGADAAARKAQDGIPCTPCFVAGTLVLTERGLIAIDELAPGDVVLSRDEHGDEVDWQEVVQTFETEDRPLLELIIETDDGEQVLVTTPEHPFASVARGWVSAGDLDVGELLVTADGSWVQLSSGTWLQERATVYNLEVNEFHTYFVGEAAVWVHNANPCGDPVGGGHLRSPKTIQFSHDTINGRFLAKPKAKVQSLVGRLRADPSYATKVEPVAIARFKDLPADVQTKLRNQGASRDSVWALDNRRLYAARVAGTDVNVRWATPDEISTRATLRRFSTRNNGGLPKVR